MLVISFLISHKSYTDLGVSSSVGTLNIARRKTFSAMTKRRIKKMMTSIGTNKYKTLRALQVVADCKSKLGISAKAFGVKYFDTDEHRYLLTSVSNIGNGATSGVKAWLQAGSLLSKLANKGLIMKIWGRYILTEEGRKVLEESKENENKES